MGLINYTPAYQLNELIDKRLIELTLTDQPGYSSDTLTIKMEAGGLTRDDYPKSGDVLRLSLGWRETGLWDMGSFIVSKVKPSYLPKELNIVATSAPFNANPGTDAKLRRSQSYESMTLGDIVKVGAERMGLTALIHPELTNIKIAHADQKNETDLSYLNRLAQYFDAVMKPIDGRLVFSKRGQIKSLSGGELSPVQLVLTNSTRSPHNALQKLKIEEPERDQFLGVRADWINQESASIEQVIVGQKPFKQLPGRYKSAEEALRLSQAELRRMNRQGIKINYKVAGNPLLMSEGVVNLTGLDEDYLTGNYSNDRVIHKMTKTTYQTTGEASALIES